MDNTQFVSNYTEHYSALLNFARKLARNQVDAEELVQETACKAFQGRHTFKKGACFKSWAFTILKNTFISDYHKRKKRKVVNNSIDDFTFALENKQTVNNNGIARLELQEIKKCISNLSRKSRIPFLMHVKGFRYKEIARSLNIPKGTVKSRINFARTKLKTSLTNLDIAAA